jgi:hypothetical protein
VRLAGSIFLALGCAAAIPAHAKYCDESQPGQRVDLNCIPEMDLLTDATLRLAHAPSVHDILSQPESLFAKGYVAAIKDELFIDSTYDTIDGINWRIGKIGNFPDKVCLPDKVPITFDMIIDAVRSYPEMHLDVIPDYNRLSFLTVLPIALFRAYPCPSSLRKRR